MVYIEIIEAPTNLGLKEPSPGQEPGVNKLPAYLKRYGFYDHLKPVRISQVTPPAYSGVLDGESGVRHANEIIDYSIQLSEAILQVISRQAFPVVVGGDCSIVIGNMLALKKSGRYGLFYIDGHTDFVLPEMSDTGGAAGMDLAIVTGHGPQKLTNIHHLKPYVKERHTMAFGNRSFEDKAYVDAIMQSQIHYRDLQTIRAQGIESCCQEFLQIVTQEKLDGFWIHLDVDVLNDTLMPAVDARQPDGFSYEELNQTLSLLFSSKAVAGLDITILDPDLDPDGDITQTFILSIMKGLKHLL